MCIHQFEIKVCHDISSWCQIWHMMTYYHIQPQCDIFHVIDILCDKSADNLHILSYYMYWFIRNLSSSCCLTMIPDLTYSLQNWMEYVLGACRYVPPPSYELIRYVGTYPPHDHIPSHVAILRIYIPLWWHPEHISSSVTISWRHTHQIRCPRNGDIIRSWTHIPHNTRS